MTVALSFEVVGGALAAGELASWLQEAVDRYHTFRGGNVGLGCTAGITRPQVTIAPE